MNDFDPAHANCSQDLDDSLLETETTVIAYAVELMQLSKDLKSRLMTRLGLPALPVALSVKTPLQDLLEWSFSDLIAAAAAIEDWTPLPSPASAEMACWKTDNINRQMAYFVRAPLPGALPIHWHATGEIVLVLEGDFVSGGVTYEVGDRLFSPADTTHQTLTTGCLVLLISSLDDRLVEAGA